MDDIRIETIVAAKPEHVYAAFTNDAMLASWLANDVRTDVRVNGYYHFYWTDGMIAAGIFKQVEVNQRLVFSWFATGEAGETEVEVTFAPEGEEKTKLMIVHCGFGDGEAWANTRQGAQEGWDSAMTNLHYYVETGLDRRFMTRPMLGIFLANLNDQLKERHNLKHVPHGVLIEGTQADSAAEKAGFQQHDVIVGMDGDEIQDYYGMLRVLRRHEAGDTIPVEVWRGSDKLNATLTFDARPVPDLPQTHAELVAKVKEKLALVKQELSELLRDVPEEHMEHKPAPGEWSINDQLAHMLVSERSAAYATWMIVNGDAAYPYGNNDVLHLALGSAGHDGSAALIAELFHTLDEVVAVAEALPENVIDNRALFLQLAYQYSFVGDHIRQHFAQIRGCLESVKAAAVPA